MMPTELPPEETPRPTVETEPAPEETPAAREYRWYHKAGAVLLITFCLDIGLFLVIFPWTPYWDNFTAFLRSFQPYIDNMYVRGAISGIGVVNLYISLGEVFGLRRFSR